VGSSWIRRSRSSKVVDFCTNQKRVCNFLLVRHSNLGPILHRFGDIAVFCAPEWPHPYSTLILGVFPLHQTAHLEVSPSRGLKLFGREITSEVFKRMWSRYLNVTDRRTDRQTTYCNITALCVASHSKNHIITTHFTLTHYTTYEFNPLHKRLLVTNYVTKKTFFRQSCIIQ